MITEDTSSKNGYLNSGLTAEKARKKDTSTDLTNTNTNTQRTSRARGVHLCWL
jgi:hypothetical protein